MIAEYVAGDWVASDAPADLEVVDNGSIWSFLPLSGRAHAWIAENVDAEPWQWLGGALAVDARMAFDLACGMGEGGLRLRNA